MDSVCSNGRISGTEHNLIGNRICDAQSSILNSVCNEGRTNGSEHAAISNRVCDTQGKILTSICDNSHKIARDVRQVGYLDLKNQCDATSSIKNQVVGTSNTVRNAVERRGDMLKDNIIYSASDLKNAVNRNGQANLLSTERNGKENLLSVERNSVENRAQAERIAASNRLYLDQVNTNVLLTAKDNLLELCKTQNRLQRQAADNKASIELEALKNKEALARQLADCCCEIKEQSAKQSCDIKQLVREQSCDIKVKIDARANETQLLLRNLDTARLRDDLTAANTENVILRTSC